MVITKTPFRISFFGGGTDYPEWVKNNVGSVLSTTIDKYCYINCRRLPPFFDTKHRIVYSKIENVNNLDDIRHPVVREALKLLGNYDSGYEIHHNGDLPARSGLGSSSAFAVGIINAISEHNNNIIGKKELSDLAIYIEQVLLKESVGLQDQVSTAYGGFNRIDFIGEDNFKVSPIRISKSRKIDFSNHLLLFFTGIQRFSSNIAKSQIDNIKVNNNELFLMRDMVDEAINILENEETSIMEIGRLLNESWKIKRTLSKDITTTEIDKMYNKALDSGASGGKLLGAGGGGFLLFLAPIDRHEDIKKSLSDLVHVPFNFENKGSVRIY
jgi:D-glycero-alpha-D-manno-heptose-7-phosphate kinase